MTNYVVFCGGRGSASLLRYMTANNVSTGSKITAIINGLDDGASTGTIRSLLSKVRTE